ncbi:hypothetical protein ACLB2K_026972 [Fragaria x ananassa]
MQIGSCSTALVERYDATVREVLTKEYNQALEERDSALNELDNMGEELMEEFKIFGRELNKVVQNLSKTQAELEQRYKEHDSLELGKKVWEAERMEMAEKIEMAEKEKENAYCKGYLDGWFKKPHAHVHAWHEAKLAAEISGRGQEHHKLHMQSWMDFEYDEHIRWWKGGVGQAKNY